MGLLSVEEIPTSLAMYNSMTEFEEAMAEIPQTQYGDDVGVLEHSFTPGLYIRKISVAAGTVIVTKLHQTEHPYFVLSGKFAVLTDEHGWQVREAPVADITRVGTKRVVVILEDVVWITVHKTDSIDLEEIEKELIADTYEDMMEHLNKEVEICLT